MPDRHSIRYPGLRKINQRRHGRDAYLSLECPGIKPTFTENLAITVVVNTCLDGSLQNQLNKLY